VAETLVSQVISKYGIPLEIHTNQERNFKLGDSRNWRSCLD